MTSYEYQEFIRPDRWNDPQELPSLGPHSQFLGFFISADADPVSQMYQALRRSAIETSTINHGEPLFLPSNGLSLLRMVVDFRRAEEEHPQAPYTFEGVTARHQEEFNAKSRAMWLDPFYSGGRLKLEADQDGVVLQRMVGYALRRYDGFEVTPSTIIASKPQQLQRRQVLPAVMAGTVYYGASEHTELQVVEAEIMRPLHRGERAFDDPMPDLDNTRGPQDVLVPA